MDVGESGASALLCAAATCRQMMHHDVDADDDDNPMCVHAMQMTPPLLALRWPMYSQPVIDPPLCTAIRAGKHSMRCFLSAVSQRCGRGVSLQGWQVALLQCEPQGCALYGPLPFSSVPQLPGDGYRGEAAHRVGRRWEYVR